MVDEAWKQIPDHFRFEMENVSIRIETRPSIDQLKRVKGASTLLGLFDGFPKIAWGQAMTGIQSSKISLFQEPILQNSRSIGELRNLIQEVLMHEVAHYFGYNDEDMCLLDQKLRQKLATKNNPS
jgi:predicted Zn-dependent protease with MMP-like domain